MRIRLLVFCIFCIIASTAYTQSDCPPKSTTCHVEATGNGTITSSTFKRSNAATVADTEIGAATAMIFLFDVMPELQTLHNERLNAIEGEYAEEYYALDDLISIEVPMTRATLPSSTVHGYHLGESWENFLASSPTLKANTEKCLQINPLKQSKRHQVYDPCADVRYMQAKGTGTVTMDCVNSDVIKSVKCKDFNGEITFVDKRLVGMKIILPNVSLEDAKAKFGPPSGQDNDDSSEIWHSQQYDVAVDKMDNGIALMWETPDQYILTFKSQEHLVKTINAQEHPVANGSF